MSLEVKLLEAKYYCFMNTKVLHDCYTRVSYVSVHTFVSIIPIHGICPK